MLIHCTTARCEGLAVCLLETGGGCAGRSGPERWSGGGPPAAQQEAYNAGDGEEGLLRETALIDLRGRTSLIELAGACQLAKAVISVDAGPLHIAAAVNTPTLAVVGNDATGVGASPIRLWLPRSSICSARFQSTPAGMCPTTLPQ